MKNVDPTNRQYSGIQNVDTPELPYKPTNALNRQNLRTLFTYWNAAYRGLVPHGVRTPAPVIDDERDADTFEESVPTDLTQPILPGVEAINITPIPVVLVDDISETKSRVGTYFTAYTENVQAVTTQRVIPPQRNRIKTFLQNAGPGTVWIAQDESVGVTGFPLAAAMTMPLELDTTREVWAIQQSGQSGVAKLSIMLLFERRIEQS